MELHVVVHVTRAALPLARISFFERHGCTLVVIELEGSLHHVFVRRIGNRDIATEVLTVHLHGILTGSLEFGEIHQLYALVAAVPRLCLTRSYGKDRLSARIDEFHLTGVPFEQRQFLHVVSAVTDLVDICRCGKRKGCCRKGNGQNELFHGHSLLHYLFFKNIYEKNAHIYRALQLSVYVRNQPH